MADLAFRYGTINKSDFDRANEIHAENRGKVPYSKILVQGKIATEYQVGLLKLIQDYYIIRKKGEQFGKIAVQKGYVLQSDIEKALEFQKKEFKRAKLKKRIGDIFVENGTITPDQRDEIVAEQQKLEREAENIVQEGRDMPESATTTIDEKRGIEDSDYENEYRLIQKQDATFIQSVRQKGLATESEISAAEKKQRREYEKKKYVSRIGEILVKWKIITEKQKQVILETIRARESKKENESRKILDIEVCETGMTAFARIDRKNGAPVEPQDVKNLLAEYEIAYGVFSNAMIRSFLDTNISFFPVAGGDFPAEETGRVVLYHFDTEKEDKQAQKVKKGAVLAELKLSENDIFGRDIRGNVVNGAESLRLRPLLRPAAGAVFSETREKVIAEKSGVPALTVEKHIYVHPGVHILEDADMRTGPIEEWSDINVKGILSDEFQVKAGSVAAGEIRGTDVTATGDVNVEIGITGAGITTQGNLKARYLRNCIIETFGNVTVDSEIIDSTIRIGGKLKAANARILNSKISAKGGIDAGAIGSEVTDPCELTTGRDDLLVEKFLKIDEQMEQAKEKLNLLKEEREDKKHRADTVFERMKELKRFHDRTENKKKKIQEDAQNSLSDAKRKSDEIQKDLEAKLASIIQALKTMNREKKEIDLAEQGIRERIEKIEPSVDKKLADLERDRLNLFKWARKTPENPEIKIRVSVKQDTVFKGIYNEAVTDKEYGPLLVIETLERSPVGKTMNLKFHPAGGSDEKSDFESKQDRTPS